MAKINILLKQFVFAAPLKPPKRISWNFVVMKDKLVTLKSTWFFKKKLFCANQTHLYPLGPLFNLQLPLFAPIHWTIQPRIRASSRERASLIETTPPSPIVVRVWRTSQEGHLRMTLHNLNIDQWNSAFRRSVTLDRLRLISRRDEVRIGRGLPSALSE